MRNNFKDIIIIITILLVFCNKYIWHGRSEKMVVICVCHDDR